MDPTKIARRGVEYKTASGKTVVLLWSHFALMEAEKAGLNQSAGTYTRELLGAWALLLTRNPGLTLQEVGDFLDDEREAGRQAEFEAACFEAMRKARVIKELPQDPQIPATTD